MGSSMSFVEESKQWFGLPDEARWLPIELRPWPQAVVWAHRRASPTTGSSATDDRKHPLAEPDEEGLRRETARRVTDSRRRTLARCRSRAESPPRATMLRSSWLGDLEDGPHRPILVDRTPVHGGRVDRDAAGRQGVDGREYGWGVAASADCTRLHARVAQGSSAGRPVYVRRVDGDPHRMLLVIHQQRQRRAPTLGTLLDLARR